jgi:hypothetical protein
MPLSGHNNLEAFGSQSLSYAAKLAVSAHAHVVAFRSLLPTKLRDKNLCSTHLKAVYSVTNLHYLIFLRILISTLKSSLQNLDAICSPFYGELLPIEEAACI